MKKGISTTLPNSVFRSLRLWPYVFACLIHMPASATELTADEAALKAVFVYNFARFTRWPAEVWQESGGSFHICTLGSNPVTEALAQLRGQKLKGREIVIRHLKKHPDSKPCQLLYIVDPAIDVINEVDCCLPVLTISGASGFSRSVGMIELFIRNEKVRFNINLGVVRNSGMDINAQLLRLADRVIQESFP